jgi:hypothetical protein
LIGVKISKCVSMGQVSLNNFSRMSRIHHFFFFLFCPPSLQPTDGYYNPSSGSQSTTNHVILLCSHHLLSVVCSYSSTCALFRPCRPSIDHINHPPAIIMSETKPLMGGDADDLEMLRRLKAYQP